MRSPFILVALASVGAVGCFAPAPEDRPDAEAASQTATALVVVERTTGPGDAIRGDAVIARFVRVRLPDTRAVDDQALRIAGAGWDLPPVGSCSTGDRIEAQPALQPRTVDLLDVGALTVDSALANSKSTIIHPRAMPDPTGLVSGVLYSGRSAEAFAPAARLQFHANGGPDLPEGFLVNVASPRDVSDVRVASSASGAGGAGGAGLDVTWEVDGASDARDLVYVDVLGPSARLIARCTTLDVGHIAVPASTLGAIDEGQLSVHRLHRESFRAKGIEPGEIRFDIARVVTFSRSR